VSSAPVLTATSRAVVPMGRNPRRSLSMIASRLPWQRQDNTVAGTSGSAARRFADLVMVTTVSRSAKILVSHCSMESFRIPSGTRARAAALA
jgi:hypothetical protein